MAMRTARETPGAYGSTYIDVPMAFDVVESDDTEDHYRITLAFRPEGAFTGTPGREQFFIEKEGNLAVRQVLSLPGSAAWRRYRLALIAIGLVVVVAAAVGGVSAATGGGGGNDGSAPLAAALPTSTPERPVLTSPPAPTTAPVGIPPVVPTATPTPAPAPTATVPVLASTPTPRPTPTTPTPIPRQRRMVAWWPADGNANDVVGGHHAALLGGATYAPGQYGQAFSLTTAGAGIRLPGQAVDGLSDITMVVWIKPTRAGGALLSGANLSHDNEYSLFLEGTGSDVVTLRLKGSGGTNSDALNTPGIEDGNFHHLAWVRRSDGANDLYLDGVLSGRRNLPIGL